jgi:hypothetical protein
MSFLGLFVLLYSRQCDVVKNSRSGLQNVMRWPPANVVSLIGFELRHMLAEIALSV